MTGTGRDLLTELAEFVRRKNVADQPIARLIGRPALPGHFGEFVAARIFDIELNKGAAKPGFDGRFRSGELTGKSVNIKFYTKHDRLLDMTEEGKAGPDYYLVMTGPDEKPGPSRGKPRPWVIVSVFLFEAAPLVDELKTRSPKKKIGVATYVPVDLWARAMIYSNCVSPLLPVTEARRDQLSLFSAARIACNE